MTSLPEPDLAHPPPRLYVIGSLSPRPEHGYDTRCVMCNEFYPRECVLDLGACLHCAGLHWSTAIAAANRKAELDIFEIKPSCWDIIQNQNKGRHCLNPKCGIEGNQPTNRSTTLGVEQWCIACVLDRQRQRTVIATATEPAHRDAGDVAATDPEPPERVARPRGRPHKVTPDNAQRWEESVREEYRKLGLDARQEELAVVFDYETVGGFKKLLDKIYALTGAEWPRSYR